MSHSTVYSAESGRSYRLDRLIGKGTGKHGGSKLIEVRRLAAEGHRVTIIGERQFWRLVTAKRRR